MEGLNRAQLLYEHHRLLKQMEGAGLEAVVTDDGILDAFNDAELLALVKDCALRLVRFRRLEGEL